MFGKVAGEEAASFAQSHDHLSTESLENQAKDIADRTAHIRNAEGGDRISTLRTEMAKTMEDGCGMHRTEAEMEATCAKLAELKDRYQKLHLDDHSSGWNTEWLLAIELGFQLDVAQAMAHSAINRKESRGSHQRLDGFEERDDENFLKHSLAFYNESGEPRIDYQEVKITKSRPGVRAYGAAGEEAEQKRKEQATAGGDS